MKFFLLAGEASGDIHAAGLIAELKRQAPGSEFCFLGGDLMAAEAGKPPVVHYRDMAFMGFIDVVRNLDKVRANLKAARRVLEAEKPDALILVDYPSFNLRVASTAFKMGIPVFYYISPKVWAWKEGRVKKIKKICRRVLSILPFEPEFYRKRHGMEIDYVGNPSLKEVDELLVKAPSREEFFASCGLDTSRKLLALVPGSRVGEIRKNLPVMIAAAALHPEMQAVIAAAPGIDPALYSSLTSLPTIEGKTFELIANADVALVTSGTATLETALAGTPQIVCYRANGSKLTYKLFSKILKVKYVSLPNLIAGEDVVPEMLLHLCTPEAISPLIEQLADHHSSAYQRQQEGYRIIRRRLTTSNAPATAASLILSSL